MTDKVFYDIETLMPWQKDLLTGIRKGEMTIMMSGRRTGKSTFSAQAFQRLWDDIYKKRPVEDLILSEGTVFGARYLTIEPVGGDWKDMEEWCTSTFGEAAEVWDIKSTDEQFIWPECGRWYMNDRKFWFRNERDRDWFVIRWNA